MLWLISLSPALLAVVLAVVAIGLWRRRNNPS
jgi:MYXO-CTERM domain-containing protein